jgi:antitoxin component of MazEF toxin-antitoxin module
MEQIVMRTTLRKIGNSRGVILTKEIIDKLKIVDGQEIELTLNDRSTIILKPTKNKKKKRPSLNLDLSTWENQFKTAIKKGEVPENDVFEGMSNKFDKSW